MDWRRVEPSEIDALWPEIEDLVCEACARSSGRYTGAHAREFASQGRWQFWIVRDDEGSVCFIGGTEICDYPTGLRTLAWRFGTGHDHEKWAHLMGAVLELAKKECGCTMAEGAFRRGWKRVFTAWRHTHDVLEIDL